MTDVAYNSTIDSETLSLEELNMFETVENPNTEEYEKSSTEGMLRVVGAFLKWVKKINPIYEIQMQKKSILLLG